MTTTKLCVDCVHAKYLDDDKWEHRRIYGIGAFDSGYYCARTEYGVSRHGELVSGYDQKRMLTCQRERERWSGCGKKGKFFEPAEKSDE